MEVFRCACTDVVDADISLLGAAASTRPRVVIVQPDNCGVLIAYRKAGSTGFVEKGRKLVPIGTQITVLCLCFVPKVEFLDFIQGGVVYLEFDVHILGIRLITNPRDDGDGAFPVVHLHDRHVVTDFSGILRDRGVRNVHRLEGVAPSAVYTAGVDKCLRIQSEDAGA
ncbi:MAG: hypothetical protein LBT13_09255 [Treponema sp.]|nr:hypothetical protein [Treponema sp.]